ncbi:MAG: hypothetical protein B7733_02375 [Myxococcales bacterium FL481]|nr:MAG: hypothetical protein B7733_02375 [Myxococcales bacterium FL481]
MPARPRVPAPSSHVASVAGANLCQPVSPRGRVVRGLQRHAFATRNTLRLATNLDDTSLEDALDELVSDRRVLRIATGSTEAEAIGPEPDRDEWFRLVAQAA